MRVQDWGVVAVRIPTPPPVAMAGCALLPGRWHCEPRLAAPRASSVTAQHRHPPALWSPLLCCRYCKTGLLAALVAERLGPGRWRGRWYRHGRALRPLGEVPPEALAFLQRWAGRVAAQHTPKRV